MESILLTSTLTTTELNFVLAILEATGSFRQFVCLFVCLFILFSRAFRYSHQIFYQDHALYLVMFDITRPIAGTIAEVKGWISAIEARVKQKSEGDFHFCVYLVGTQADKLKEGEKGEERALNVKEVFILLFFL